MSLLSTRAQGPQTPYNTVLAGLGSWELLGPVTSIQPRDRTGGAMGTTGVAPGVRTSGAWLHRCPTPNLEENQPRSHPLWGPSTTCKEAQGAHTPDKRQTQLFPEAAATKREASWTQALVCWAAPRAVRPPVCRRRSLRARTFFSPGVAQKNQCSHQEVWAWEESTSWWEQAC